METVIFFVIAVAVGYLVSLRLWPYAPCPRCGRSGRNTGSNARRWGDCRKCGGSGKRIRLGARIVFRRD